MKKLINIAVLSIVGILCACVILTLIGGPTVKTQPARIPATEVAQATVHAPAPTAVPQPTNALTVDTSAIEVQQYLNQVEGQTTKLASALSDVGTLLQHPRFGNNEWTIGVASDLAAIRVAHKQLTEINPPAAMRDIHTSLIDATGDCNQATYHLASGLDAMNVAEVNTATDLIGSCSTKITRTTQLVNDYTASHK